MHRILVWLTARDAEQAPRVAELLAEAGRLSRREPGCERFEVYHSQADPRRFLLCEHWRSKSDWETHRTGEAYTRIYTPQVLPLVERDAHVSDLLE